MRSMRAAQRRSRAEAQAPLGMDKQDTCEVCCTIMPRILLVDDDHILLRIYQSKLTKEGYSVNAVGDGTAALSELQHTSPDLILLDLMLPDMNGVEVIRAVRAAERERHLPIIVLSNVYLSEDTDAARAAGADRVFAKSVTSPRTVVDAIRELIQQRAAAFPEAVLPQPISSPIPLPDLAVLFPLQPQVNQCSPEASVPVTLPEVELQTLPELTSQFVRSDAFSRQLQATMNEVRLLLGRLAHEAHLLAPLSRLYHAIGDHAVIAHRWDVAKLAAACESLIHQIRPATQHLNPSTVRTLKQATDQIERLARARNAHTELKSVRVLALDDERVSRTLMELSLHKVGLSTTLVATPQEALEAAKNTVFHLILSDVMMAGMSGFQFAKRVRELPGYAHIPIIMVTALSEFTTQFRASANGADDLIAKPFIPMELGIKALIHILHAVEESTGWQGSDF